MLIFLIAIKQWEGKILNRFPQAVIYYPIRLAEFVGDFIEIFDSLVFWSESTGFGQTKSIVKKADLSGGLVSVVLDEGLQRLTDLAVDSLHQMVYWLDADRREVERISYNGTNKQTIFSSPVIKIFGNKDKLMVRWDLKGIPELLTMKAKL